MLHFDLSISWQVAGRVENRALSTVTFAVQSAQINVSRVWMKKKTPQKLWDTENVWNPSSLEVGSQRQEVIQLKPPQVCPDRSVEVGVGGLGGA